MYPPWVLENLIASGGTRRRETLAGPFAHKISFSRGSSPRQNIFLFPRESGTRDRVALLISQNDGAVRA